MVPAQTTFRPALKKTWSRLVYQTLIVTWEYIVIVISAPVPIQPVFEPALRKADSKIVSYGNSRLTGGTFPVVRVFAVDRAAAAELQEKAIEKKSEKSENPPRQQKSSDQDPQAHPEKDSADAASEQPSQSERRSFWERVFNVPPVRTRIEKALTEKWKFSEIRPRHIDGLLADDEEDARRFFLDGANARQYQRLVKEFGCGFETRNGKVVDDSFDTLSEYGPELIAKYPILMENRELIKKYYAGVFRDGRIGSQSLIRISDSLWSPPFGAARFRQYASVLHSQFQVPDHVIGPMLASVGDSFWLLKVLFRKSSPQAFQQLLNKIAPSTEGSANAFAPALQLLVVGEQHRIPVDSLNSFVDSLKLKPEDFGPFSAIVYNLGAYRLADEIKCPTFAVFLRRELDEFGGDINQESGRLFVQSYREFKDNMEALQAFNSPEYSDTKAFLKSVGTVSSSVWNMQRIAILAHTLTPEKRTKIARLARELSSELTVADIMFLADIADNEDECKLLLNRQALIESVKDFKIDRIVERSQNDLVKELQQEIDIAHRSGLFRTVRRLSNMVKEEKRAYTERVEPDKLSNIQLSRLLIFQRSLDMPGFLDTVGWNVSLDIQNERSEGGGYLGYDKDMAMVTMVSGQPGDNKAYRPVNLDRAPASLALFHNHAFKDTFADRYLGFLSWMFPSNKNKSKFAGPSGWLGAEKGDITAAALSELPSFIITKIGHPENPDGTKDLKKLSVNFDWVIVDQQTGEALRSDRGVFTVPFYGEETLGKLKWPSGREQKRREKERREKCPPLMKQASAQR